MKKPKVLFVYDHKYPRLWKDGLWAAIKLLEDDFSITWLNLQESENAYKKHEFYKNEFVFALGWGGFGSPVDKFLQESLIIRRGLCIGGNAIPYTGQNYDVLFYETNISRKLVGIEINDCDIKQIHAFGINSKIYKPQVSSKIWDYLSVGSFSFWKRHNLICEKRGSRMVIGEIQRQNIAESYEIITYLLNHGVAVSDMVEPETLAVIYNASKNIYIPADINGGGERAVLEARACGIPVEVENDNPKLKELLASPVWDEKYYARQLKKGIMACLK